MRLQSSKAQSTLLSSTGLTITASSARAGRARGRVLVRGLALNRLRAGRRNEGDEEGGGVECAMRRVHYRQPLGAR